MKGKQANRLHPPVWSVGQAPTIRAHLIPESFIREIQMKPKSGEQHLIIHPDQDHKQASKTGRYEPRILCGPCDGKTRPL